MLDSINLLRKAKEMQQKMQEAQQKFSDMRVTGEAGAGLVRVTANCQYEFKEMFIDPVLLKEPLEVVQDVIVAAFNDASAKAKNCMKEGMLKISRELGLPEDFGEVGGTESGG